MTLDQQPALDARWIQEFYESGARASTKTENIEISAPTIGSAGLVFRLDTLINLSLQTVVVWSRQETVRVVIVATRVEPGASREGHESRVKLAVTQSAAS